MNWELQFGKVENEFIHGMTVEDTWQLARQAVLHVVIYQTPPILLPHFPNPRDVPLETRHCKGTHTLAAWLQLVEQQLVIKEQERQQDREPYGTIVWYLGRPSIIDPG